MKESKRSVKVYDLLTFSITNCWGQETDIHTLFTSFTVTESVFRKGTRGTVSVVDDLGLFEMLPLVGDEYINISFRTDWMGVEDPIYDRTFRIYRIDNGKQYSGATRSYIIHFISPEVEHNESVYISRSYKGKTSDMIVRDVWNNLSDVDALTCVESVNAPRYIIPNLHPFDAISWLSENSVSDKGYSDYVLYENRDGWNWLPLRSLMDDEPIQTIRRSMSNISNLSSVSRDNAEDIEFSRLYDTIEMCRSGLYGVDETQYSLVNKTVNIEGVSYNDRDFVEMPRANASVIEQCDMPIGAGMNLIRGNDPETVYQGSHKPLMRRKQLMSEWKGNTWSITGPGNSNQTCGKVIYLDLPSMSINNSDEVDGKYGGRYLITDINHHFNQTEYTTGMTIRSNILRTE